MAMSLIKVCYGGFKNIDLKVMKKDSESVHIDTILDRSNEPITHPVEPQKSQVTGSC
jgi:hypothetical protein